MRAAVERDFTYARREESLRRFHAELVSRFNVTVEWPDSAKVDDDKADEPTAGERQR